ncbi:MAG: hypothetical protein WBL85_05265, partial [Sedimentisphaerales bacterium]
FTGEDLSPAKNARWVIIRKHSFVGKEQKMRDYLQENIPTQELHKIIINYPDILFENRENPNEHRFRTDTEESNVVIYERMN